MRAAVYIDGFNAYHAIERLGEPILKWLDYRSLANSMLREGDTLERVVMYTALCHWNAEKRARHINYLAALRSTGVEVQELKFTRPSKFCRKEQKYCKNYEEKQTDVAIAVDILSDCYDGVAERIVLVTADSDQVPLVKKVRATFPEKIVFLFAPPGRLGEARDLGQCCNGVAELKREMLRKHLLPPVLLKSNGKMLATCPPEYGPHPNSDLGEAA